MGIIRGALDEGSHVGRYVVESFLGAGGMGEVYVALDPLLGRQIALKILPSTRGGDRIERFIREAQTSSIPNHPAIVSVYDAGSADGMQFLAMELIDGEPLAAWMRSHSDRSRGVELMAQVADGLARAHDSGIVHRDIKPANIMVGRDGYAKIVDFGAAKLTECLPVDDGPEVKTARISTVGTPAYMSPEQVERGAVDNRSDIFSFGTILYELLTGRQPFAEVSFVDTIHNVVHRHPPLRTVPRRWRRIVSRCLAKEPLERYQSMRDVAHDLRDSLAEPGMAGGLTTDARLWLVAIVLAAVLIALLMSLRENFTEEIRRMMLALTPRSCSTAFTAALSLPVHAWAPHDVVPRSHAGALHRHHAHPSERR